MPNSGIDAKQIIQNIPLKEIRKNLFEWWESGGQRHYPWRETRDIYKVLVAEILLHRTKAEQVASLYKPFLEKYPDIHSIAQSSSDELAISFHSVGLHWRWKLFHSMAVDIENRFHGKVPQDFDDLISLPGVSNYIASAVRCFALEYPDILLDTNIVRVIGRIFGLPITDSSRRSKLFREVLEQLIDLNHPREFNFALLDFAASICKPKMPDHSKCPVFNYCHFYIQTLT